MQEMLKRRIFELVLKFSHEANECVQNLMEPNTEKKHHEEIEKKFTQCNYEPTV